MGTSTNRPKPKSGQSAGKNVSGQQSAEQQAADAKTGGSAQLPKAKTQPAKTMSGALPSTSKTPTGKTPTGPASVKVVSKAQSSPAKPPPGPLLSKREKQREARREEMSRRIEERRQQRERELRQRRAKRWAIFGIPTAVAAALIGIFVYNLLFGPQVAAYLRGETIDGITCGAEQLATHYHAHLRIYVNGTQVPVPNDVGRQSRTGCLYLLHTHASDGDEGVIHIESPDNRVFTLKQFFDIWGQDFSVTSLLGHKVDASHKLTVYVYNPTEQPSDAKQPFTVTPPENLEPYTDDPTKIQLKPHQLIVLAYGTPVPKPTAWTFLAGE